MIPAQLASTDELYFVDVLALRGYITEAVALLANVDNSNIWRFFLKFMSDGQQRGNMPP